MRVCVRSVVEGGAKMELPWHRARGKQRSMRDAPVSGSSLYDFRLRASSARHDPQPPQLHHMICTLLCLHCAHRRRI